MIDSDILPVLSSYETGSLRDINVEYVAVFMNNVGWVRGRLSHPHGKQGFPSVYLYKKTEGKNSKLLAFVTIGSLVIKVLKII